MNFLSIENEELKGSDMRFATEQPLAALCSKPNSLLPPHFLLKDLSLIQIILMNEL